MKTTEEKAKAYDEVVNKLRHFIAKGVDPLITRADVQDFFPELAENKDERIRKALKQYFVNSFQNNGVAAICGVHIKDVLAWLEKQGQVKESFISQHEIETCKENDDSLTSEDEKVIKEIIELVMQPTWKTEEEFHRRNVLCAWLENVPYTIDHEKREGFHLGYRTCLERQGEQKPAGKDELKFKVGDKIYLKPEYRMPDDDTPIANTVKEIRRVDDKHYRFDGAYIFIEDQDKYELVEQKPAWSEEDEQHIDSLLKRLDALCRNKFERTRFAISEDRDWLKSLRPQNMWKPSEDDIIILEKLIKGELEPKVFQATLHGILEQLKKLKEE